MQISVTVEGTTLLWTPAEELRTAMAADPETAKKVLRHMEAALSLFVTNSNMLAGIALKKPEMIDDLIRPFVEALGEFGVNLIRIQNLF